MLSRRPVRARQGQGEPLRSVRPVEPEDDYYGDEYDDVL